jgi:glycosyltransferase involved in cell wall biosynthesis
MNRKKRILWVSEASFLNTGFSVLSYEILKRLYDTGKYEILELGSYAKSSDQRALNIPWNFAGAIPEDNDTFGKQLYNSSVYGQFGEAVFDKVCLKFKPDIVIDSRDRWMSSEWQLMSPFRKYFKYIIMPTVDGEPQRSAWLDDYQRADLVLTYSRYGKEVLEREASGKVDVFDIVRPGVNQDIYKPLDKNKIRKHFGIDANSNIIMTVMRNQKRKLYPDLIEMFKGYLEHCKSNGREDLVKNTYLYLHASYPDVGYDIPKYIMKNNLGHKVLMTYACSACKAYYPAFFQSELSICKKCGNLSAYLPNTGNGLSREELASIMNIADLYIQYSICEGLGMPICEAKACGVPAFAVDYSAMSEQVEVEGCEKINVERFFHESVMETEQQRALPDNEDCIKKIFKFFNTNKETRAKWGDLARQDAADNYSFDRSAKIFENAIDSVAIHDSKDTWLSSKPKFLKLPKIPEFGTNSELIDWCIDNVLKNPDLKKTQWRHDLIKSLNVGYTTLRGGKERFNADIALSMFKEMVDKNNFWENNRINSLTNNKKSTLKFEVI